MPSQHPQHIREQSNEIQEQVNYDIVSIDDHDTISQIHSRYLYKIRNVQNKDHTITVKNVESVSVAKSRDKHGSIREAIKDNT